MVLTPPQQPLCLDLSGFNFPSKPPSRGMQASSSRCAPMSSARTPTRVGFKALLAKELLTSPHCIRSTDGGCVARQHWSAATGGGRRARQRGGLSHHERKINWNLTPINHRTPTRVGCQVVLVCKWLTCKSFSDSTPSWLARSHAFISLPQHRWWVRRPTTSERSDWRRAACPPAGRAQQKIGI